MAGAPLTERRAEGARLLRLRTGAVVVVSSPAVFRIEGRGAVQCVQGIVTNDVVAPGGASLVFGALLTPKGMIVAPVWAFREGDTMTLVTPAAARAAALDLFQRSLPPRLARVTDRTGDAAVLELVGGASDAVLGAAVPAQPGRLLAHDTVHGRVLMARAPTVAPFVATAVGDAAAIEAYARDLVARGASSGTEEDREAARILAGWPALGAEIDERTLPQEVRFDEIGGVSYTKGCYTGQETVARIHFRGHPNRELRGLIWSGATALTGDAIMLGDKPVGTVRSVLRLDDRVLGLAPIRREVEPGTTVQAAGAPAEVVLLPFAAATLEG